MLKTRRSLLLLRKLKAIYIVKSILSETVDLSRISFKDNERYFSILLDDSTRKQICRLSLDGRKKQILIPDADKYFERFYIDGLDEIYDLKSKIIDALKNYL